MAMSTVLIALPSEAVAVDRDVVIVGATLRVRVNDWVVHTVRPANEAVSGFAGSSVSVSGGTNWWGNSGGAPNSGPYGDDQVGSMCPVGATAVYIGTSRATAVPVTGSTVSISANTYVCAGAESTTVGPNPCRLTPGQLTGSFTVPTSLAPGSYNVYIDETNMTPLPGNGPDDGYQTTQGTNLGTAESTSTLYFSFVPDPEVLLVHPVPKLASDGSDPVATSTAVGVCDPEPPVP